MKISVIKEPVKIRLKELKNGNKSIYLDYYMGAGRREYKFLNLYLHPERSKEDREWNRRQMQLANAVKSKYIIRIQNEVFGFENVGRNRYINFIEYCNCIVKEYMEKGQKSCAVLLDCAVKRLVRYRGRNVTFEQVDKAFLIGFIHFLNNDSRYYDRNRTSRQVISEEYKVVLFARIMTVLNRAVREGIIIKNPGKDIDPNMKPKPAQKSRCYLTIEEVQSIIKTEYRPVNDVKAAFLFCCFCGLRYSDVRKLTWGELKNGSDGKIQIETTMKKTGHQLYLPLSANALKWLPERGSERDKERVFKHLPSQACHANLPLKTLIRKAGIRKHVTFHVARHTFATLTLSFGADLYTVSKLLGHTRVQTTQIYAKIVDESKRKAVNLIPDL